MSSLTALRLQRPPMAPDPRSFVNFGAELGAKIDLLTAEAVAAGRWRSPEDIELNPRNPLSLAYWLYKSWNPILRAMPGSGVESTLEPFRRTHFDLTPRSFSAETERTLSVSGDLMCTKGLDGAKDQLYEAVSDLIFGADIAYANLESTLTSADISPTTFTADETPKINLTKDQYAAVVSHRGRRFDVLQLANNHILDCGEEGVRTTLAQLKHDGIEQVGVNVTDSDAQQPRIVTLKGLRIGWVAHTFSVNFKPFPPDKPWIVNMTPMHLVPDADVSGIEAQIRACRQAGCDLVIVALHWGLEFELYPHPDQLRWAHRFADAGADLIIGHHPHVPQPVEIYQPPSEPDRAVPILYSVGNLTSVVSHPSNVVSLVARLRLSTGRMGGKVRTLITGLDLTPVALLAVNVDGVDSLRLFKASDVIRRTHDAAMNDYVTQMASYADLVVGRDWRT
jgi:poly-gamma-glutamate capsule biosynthesis protein CapA/YwtB (metallophosphatase superfamily)